MLITKLQGSLELSTLIEAINKPTTPTKELEVYRTKFRELISMLDRDIKRANAVRKVGEYQQKLGAVGTVGAMALLSALFGIPAAPAIKDPNSASATLNSDNTQAHQKLVFVRSKVLELLKMAEDVIARRG